jgi:ribosomal-protein-alanine N-acetyltransferase
MVRAGPAHAQALAALHGEVFAHEPWDAASFAALLAQPGVHGLIDPRGGFVLLRVAADEAEILTIGVTRRRQGIGRSLLAAALAHAGAAGATAMFLEVAAENAAARGLYAAAGFSEVGQRRGYYADGGDALLLKLKLE